MHCRHLANHHHRVADEGQKGPSLCYRTPSSIVTVIGPGPGFSPRSCHPTSCPLAKDLSRTAVSPAPALQTHEYSDHSLLLPYPRHLLPAPACYPTASSDAHSHLWAHKRSRTSEKRFQIRLPPQKHHSIAPEGNSFIPNIRSRARLLNLLQSRLRASSSSASSAKLAPALFLPSEATSPVSLSVAGAMDHVSACQAI